MSGLEKRLNYYRRIYSAYLTSNQSHLTFWHETPEVNQAAAPGEIGQYYMTFSAKADYPGQYDSAGIPMLDYRGRVGLQYNPIAIAQYALGNYNLFLRTGAAERRTKFLTASDWLVGNLERNPAGVWVWNHHFDWEYRTPQKDPWYSALAQGQALSALIRAHSETKNDKYRQAAERAFPAFMKTTAQGGVTYLDREGYTWFEEVIAEPPTHILNGFMWAAWGIYDYHLHMASPDAQRLFAEAVRTLTQNLRRFDAGFWSLYEESGTRMMMLASPFYHRLHIVQLQVMQRLTGAPIFGEFARRWEGYRQNRIKRSLALGYKAIFKLLYY